MPLAGWWWVESGGANARRSFPDDLYQLHLHTQSYTQSSWEEEERRVEESDTPAVAATVTTRGRSRRTTRERSSSTRPTRLGVCACSCRVGEAFGRDPSAGVCAAALQQRHDRTRALPTTAIFSRSFLSTQAQEALGESRSVLRRTTSYALTRVKQAQSSSPPTTGHIYPAVSRRQCTAGQ